MHLGSLKHRRFGSVIKVKTGPWLHVYDDVLGRRHVSCKRVHITGASLRAFLRGQSNCLMMRDAVRAAPEPVGKYRRKKNTGLKCCTVSGGKLRRGDVMSVISLISTRGKRNKSLFWNFLSGYVMLMIAGSSKKPFARHANDYSVKSHKITTL